MGFDYKDVWVAYFTPPDIQNNDSAMLFHNTEKQMLKSMRGVEDVTYASFNTPFSMSSNGTNVSYGNSNHINTNIYQVEDSYKDVLNVNVKAGRWFSKEDNLSQKFIPVVINEKLSDALFEAENPIGKVIGDEQQGQPQPVEKFKVIGVVSNLKDQGDYHSVENQIFLKMDSNAIRYASAMLLKVKPGSDADFESKLFKSLSSTIGTSIDIEHLDKKRETKNKVMLVPLIIALIVAGFLIINVSLGLFGVLWYNINKRKGEIGLRRAVGASGKTVSAQLVYESIILATFSLIVGLFFAVQFPLLNVFNLPATVYIEAIILAVVFIYLLVLVCALYPGRQAAYIYPAVALHED
jgi:putative ABC transport system permease protein